MNISSLMTRPVVTVNEDSTLEDVAKTMLEHRIGCVLVVNEAGRLRGIITEADFAGEERYVPFSAFQAPQLFGKWVSKSGIEDIFAECRTMKAREIMSSPVITATEDESITKVVERMLRHDINRIPIVKNEIPVGIIARYDLLRLLVDNGALREHDDEVSKA